MPVIRVWSASTPESQTPRCPTALYRRLLHSGNRSPRKRLIRAECAAGDEPELEPGQSERRPGDLGFRQDAPMFLVLIG